MVLCIYAMAVNLVLNSYQWQQMPLTLLSNLGTVFLLLVCLDQPWYDDFWLVLLYFVLSCPAVVSLRSPFLWRRMEGWLALREGGSERELEEKRNCGWDVLSEGRIYLQYKKLKTSKHKKTNKNKVYFKKNFLSRSLAYF